jgi:hypothetical protein
MIIMGRLSHIQTIFLTKKIIQMHYFCFEFAVFFFKKVYGFDVSILKIHCRNILRIIRLFFEV